MRDPYRYTSLITFGIYAQSIRMVKRVAFSFSTRKLNSRERCEVICDTGALSGARIYMFAFFGLNAEVRCLIIKMSRQGFKKGKAKNIACRV